MTPEVKTPDWYSTKDNGFIGLDLSTGDSRGRAEIQDGLTTRGVSRVRLEDETSGPEVLRRAIGLEKAAGYFAELGDEAKEVRVEVKILVDGTEVRTGPGPKLYDNRDDDVQQGPAPLAEGEKSRLDKILERVGQAVVYRLQALPQADLRRFLLGPGEEEEQFKMEINIGTSGYERGAAQAHNSSEWARRRRVFDSQFEERMPLAIARAISGGISVSGIEEDQANDLIGHMSDDVINAAPRVASVNTHFIQVTISGHRDKARITVSLRGPESRVHLDELAQDLDDVTVGLNIPEAEEEAPEA